MKAGEGRQEQKTSKPRILGEIRWRSRAGQESWVWGRSRQTDTPGCPREPQELCRAWGGF